MEILEYANKNLKKKNLRRKIVGGLAALVLLGAATTNGCLHSKVGGANWKNKVKNYIPIWSIEFPASNRIALFYENKGYSSVTYTTLDQKNFKITSKKYSVNEE